MIQSDTTPTSPLPVPAEASSSLLVSRYVEYLRRRTDHTALLAFLEESKAVLPEASLFLPVFRHLATVRAPLDETRALSPAAREIFLRCLAQSPWQALGTQDPEISLQAGLQPPRQARHGDLWLSPSPCCLFLAVSEAGTSPTSEGETRTVQPSPQDAPTTSARQDAPVADWWMGLRPFLRLEYAVFLSLARVMARADVKLPPDFLDWRWTADSLSEPCSDLYFEEARACARWYGFSFSNAYALMTARNTQPKAHWSTVWGGGLRLWEEEEDPQDASWKIAFSESDCRAVAEAFLGRGEFPLNEPRDHPIPGTMIYREWQKAPWIAFSPQAPAHDPVDLAQISHSRYLSLNNSQARI